MKTKPTIVFLLPILFLFCTKTFAATGTCVGEDLGGREMCKNEGASCTIEGKSGKCRTTAGLGCLCKKTTLVALVENSFIATPGINVTWETASEVDNAGFFIWRGQLKPGKTECSLDLNIYAEVKRIEPFIQAQGTGASYSYFDNQVASGNSYCYALEDIDLADKSTFHLNDLIFATMP
ncbi:hypothetical protein PN36_20645 [Candidatus Thiomargarita nelsonii]|uniref:Secreted protein n=1 Tax=Candidatus Thiomargarita nelsonii TaxID=1003181 RepID=A0A0A6PI59_9GAMM|nr:hypothetical protein PN36_20645 [Candidatus Thiomargarita nelsonii]